MAFWLSKQGLTSRRLQEVSLYPERGCYPSFAEVSTGCSHEPHPPGLSWNAGIEHVRIIVGHWFQVPRSTLFNFSDWTETGAFSARKRLTTFWLHVRHSQAIILGTSYGLFQHFQLYSYNRQYLPLDMIFRRWPRENKTQDATCISANWNVVFQSTTCPRELVSKLA